MVAGVGIAVEELRMRMLGKLQLTRGAKARPLPASRKVRGLLAYLALAPRPMARSQLCELLWDAPVDPRGELRWCLSKVRAVVNDPSSDRVVTDGDTVALDLSDCFVDALEVARAADQGIEKLEVERQRRLVALFEGDFLDGLAMERSPVFEGWLTAQRRRFRACHIALLEQLAKKVPDEEAFGYIEEWRELAPFDRRAHEALLAALARRGRVGEAEAHIKVTTRLFEAEGLDPTPLRALEAKPTEAASKRGSIAVMPFSERMGDRTRYWPCSRPTSSRGSRS